MPDYSANDPNPEPDTVSHQTERGMGRLITISGLIAFGNLISRVLSFAGDTVKSHYFGAGGRVDAFNVAAAVPTLLNDLLIKSLLDSAYIPVFSSYSETERQRLAAALINLTFPAFSALVVLMEVFAPQIVSVLNGGASPATQALTVNLLHVTLPALLILNFSGIFSVLLYVRQRLLLPTLAGAVFNGAILLTALLLWARLDIFALALGLLLGALLQVAVQLFGLRGQAWPYQLLFWHGGLPRIARLFLPILGGLLVELFISRPVTFALASRTGEGGISWMNYALTLRQLPEGLIAAGLSVTVLVRLSVEKDVAAFRYTLAQGVRLALLVILPASVGLFLLARPVTALLFEHGSFTAFDTQITSQALQWYVLGLPFATLDLLLVVAFYARHDTRTPALIGVFCTLVYVGLATFLVPHFGLNSLMLADSLKFALHAMISTLLLFPALGGMAGLGIRRTLRQALLGSVIMGFVVLMLSLLPPGEGLLMKLLAVLLPMIVGLVVYVGVLVMLRADDLRWLLSALRKDRVKL